MSYKGRSVIVEGVDQQVTSVSLAGFCEKAIPVEHRIFKYHEKLSQRSSDAYVIFADAKDAIRACRDLSSQILKGSMPNFSMVTDVQLTELTSLVDGKETKEWNATTRSKSDPRVSEEKLNQVIEMLSSLGPDVCQRAIDRLSSLNSEQIQMQKRLEAKADSSEDEER